MNMSISTFGGRVRMPTPQITQTARGLIEHTDEGAGRVLVALHGGMGGADQSWLLARALLGVAPDWRVLAVSRPGYLGTPLETGRTPDEQADAVAALLDATDIKRATVAAVSAGGPVAIAFALRHPTRCAGLVLVSTPSGHMPSDPAILGRLDGMGRVARIPGASRLLGWLAGRKPRQAGLRSVRDEALLDRTLADPEAGPLMLALQNCIFPRLAHRVAGTRNDMEQLAALGALPLEKLALPVVLAVHGTGDRVVPFHHAQAVEKSAQNSTLLAIDGGEHVALFTHLREVRTAMEAFVEGLPG
jgi:pimeloyl-ACP methyl ester carboxylesterase